MSNPSPQGRDIEKEYEKLTGHRNEPLRRARENSAFSVPSLMPPDGHSETSVLVQPWQSVGARGLNNLTSRVLLTLFPPNTANWRGNISSKRLEEAGLSEDEAAEFDSALSGYEQEFRRNFEASGDRATIFDAIRTHLCTGDVLLRMLQKEAKLRYYKLDQFGVLRDLDGNILKVIVKECIAYKALPEDLKAVVPEKDPNTGSERKEVSVYTVLERMEGKRFQEFQYVEDVYVEDSRSEYPNEDDMPWRVLRHTQIPGENHGRAFFDDLIADLKTVDSLTESIVQGVALMVKTILFVRPGSPISRDKLQKAANGDVLMGDASDVTAFRLDKVADLQVAVSFVERIEARLGMSFLMNTSIQRNAERVTAEEIRFMAQELESALGGFYSRLATDLQVWYIRQRIKVMEKTGDAPQLPQGLVDIQIITGVDALGRRNELDSLDILLVGIQQQFGPQLLAKVINMNEYIRRRAAALGIDTRRLVNSEDRTQEITDEEGTNDLLKTATPEAIRQVAPLLQQPTEQA